MRIGVFICHCGTNIGGVIDIHSVVNACRALSYVAFATDYKYLCSEPGQKIIKDAIKKNRLSHIVVGSCSPRMHEKTFQNVMAEARLNSYLLRIVNLREHCSWVHSEDKEAATKKAKSLMRAGISSITHTQALFTTSVPVTKRALIVGGGIAGIQAALDVAESGFEAVIVEKEPSVGGRMSQLDKTFPTLDCSACILTPKMVEAASHPKIKIKTYSEVQKVTGSVGNFKITIRNKARYVNSKCTACGDCFKKCAGSAENGFNEFLNKRQAIYMSFPQAVPARAVIDKEACLYFKTGKCKVCQRACAIGAIDFSMEDYTEEIEAGVIIVATGYNLFDYKAYGEYGKGRHKNIITSLQLERIFSSSGPSEGKVFAPEAQKPPKDIVFIQCVGSRDERKGKTYCSKICCMYTAKHIILLKEKIPDANIIVFYTDLRTAGKAYEEFLRRAQSQKGVIYVRGRVSKLVKRPSGKIRVMGVDTLLGEGIEVDADIVVLATAIVSRPNAHVLSQMLGIPTDKDFFFNEAHPKLRPVETHTAGIFLAGACQGPKDIPDTVSFASAAASKAIGILVKDNLESLPMTAVVSEKDCSACFGCINICPFKAIKENTLSSGKKTAFVKEELCQGCGACVASCRSGALNLKGFNTDMILSEVTSLCQD